MLLNIVLFITSIIIYGFAPETYDLSFILIDLALFLVGAFNLLINNKDRFNVLSFNIIFLLSFFFCTYSYAIFVIGAGVEFSLSIFQVTNFEYITQAIGLSTIAITAYFCAYSYQQRKNILKSNIQIKGIIHKIKLIAKIRSIFFLTVIVNFFYFTLIMGGDSFAVTSASFLPELYKLFLILYLILNSILYKGQSLNFIDIIRYNKKAFVEIAIICLLYLVGGDRGLPISIAFILLGVYSFFYKRIKISHFVLIALLGVLSLFAIRVTRDGENSIAKRGLSGVVSTTQDAISGKSAILLFSDLMGISSEMCLGYEFVQKNGLVLPGKIFLVPLHPFPFLPSLIGRFFFDKTPYEMSASSLLNEYVGQRFGYTSNLGNHIVIDLYMHWGVIGVIIFFCFFGRCISYLDRNKYSNLFVASSYIMVLSLALYLPRDSMFTIIRPLAFLWLFCHVFHLINKTNVK